MLTKVYRIPEVERALGVSEREAFAFAHLIGSWRSYSVGQLEEAKGDLSRAIQLDPSLLDNDGEQILNGIWAWARTPFTFMSDPEAFVEIVVSHLPEELARLRWSKRRTMAGIRIVEAFGSYQQREMKRVRQAVLQALFIYPGWIRNRGMISISLESVLGPSTMRLLRRLG